MTEDDIHQPASNFVKAIFSIPENARGLFKSYLPANLVPLFDWDSLRHIPSTFIKPQFAATETDLLFSVRISDREAYVYLLFKHTSTEDPRMALRLLGYIVQIWQRFVCENPQSTKRPAVFPLVVVQGNTPSNSSTNLEDLISFPPGTADLFRQCQPGLLFPLMDLVNPSYEKL